MGLENLQNTIRNGNGRTYQSTLSFKTSIDSDEWTSVECDAVPQYDVTSTAEFTEHPLTDGSLVSDHSILRPRSMNITIKQTNTPTSDLSGMKYNQLSLDVRKSEFQPGGLLALTSSVFSGIARRAPMIITLQGNVGDRIKKLSEKLYEVHFKRLPVMLSAKNRNFPLMFIASLNEASMGAEELGHFQLELKEIIFTKTEVSKLEFKKTPAFSKQPMNAGKSAPQPSPLKSVLATGGDAITAGGF